MATEMLGLRAQILANAKIMLKPTSNILSPAAAMYDRKDSKSGSSTTLLTTNYYGDLDIVVFGEDKYTAAVMAGLTPAIEALPAPTPEGAMRKLLCATAEMLNMYIPKLGNHQRNIHGGGVFDEDMINEEIIAARGKN